jgi:hypothetical protein
VAPHFYTTDEEVETVMREIRATADRLSTVAVL